MLITLWFKSSKSAKKNLFLINKLCTPACRQTGMVKYDSPTQLSIEEFKTPFQSTLLADNKWVKLSKIVPWDKFASAYMSMMNIDFGRPGISPRIVLGALIIKHLEKLDDRGSIFGSIFKIFNTIMVTIMLLPERLKAILEQQKILEERIFRLLPDVKILVIELSRVNFLSKPEVVNLQLTRNCFLHKHTAVTSKLSL